MIGCFPPNLATFQEQDSKNMPKKHETREICLKINRTIGATVARTEKENHLYVAK